MKKIICSLFACLMLSVPTVYADNDPILIMGELPTGPMRMPIPVTAWLNDGQLEITFITNVGIVDISVVNDKNVIVYQEDVDTDITSYVDVSTTSWSSGDYVLIFMLENGTRLSGMFSL